MELELPYKFQDIIGCKKMRVSDIRLLQFTFFVQEAPSNMESIRNSHGPGIAAIA